MLSYQNCMQHWSRARCRVMYANSCLHCSMTVSTCDNPKAALFDCNAVNANKFCDFFWNSTTCQHETNALFRLRASTMFAHYFTSRGIDSFDALKSMFVSEKLKFRLKQDQLEEVNKSQLTSVFSARDVASFLDTTYTLNLLEMPCQLANIHYNYLRYCGSPSVQRQLVLANVSLIGLAMCFYNFSVD